MSTVGGGPARAPVTAVVATRDRPQMLDRCLASVRRALAPGDELVVVDSASRDAAAIADIARRHAARLLRCSRPGVDRARNVGWRAAGHALVMFTDDDVQVDAGWADAFAVAAETYPQVSFFTGRIAAPAGQDDRWQVALKDDAEPVMLDRSTRGALGHGASVAVRRDALATVNGWDEALGSGGRFAAAPEADLFDRLLGHGYLGRYEPSALAWHDQWRGRGQVVRLHLRYGVGFGARLAKLLRTDRARAVVVAREAWWTWGLRSLAARLRHLDKTGTIVDVVRMVGYAVGFGRAIVTPVRDGHFRPRSRRA